MKIMARQWVATAVAVAGTCVLTVVSGEPVSTMPFKAYLVKVRPAESLRLEPTIQEVIGTDWLLRATGAPDEYRIEPRRAGVTVSVADAWEQVHRLRARGIFERAEPLFLGMAQPQAAEAAAQPGECAPTWSDGWGDDAPAPAALNDTQWSLGTDGANVVGAWALFEKDDMPGTGVSVGHPDTGYLPHPMTADARKLGPGFDFITGTTDALDQAAAGNLQWPGHGTRTGSVIAGRRGFTLGSGMRTASGVAPGARLMEMRVATRVVLLDRIDLDMGNLALAIRAAAIGDPNFVPRRADVISMSLGGAPSRAVLDAVKVAARHNVIVLAAAGNDVPHREVVFPARYDGVLAIAASNVLSKPWSGTSAGKTIAITAPGEDVWTARQLKKGDTVYNCIEVGTGTSYAVATTAGVSALWLSHHRKDMPKGIQYAAVFRQILRDTARKVVGWNTDLHGAGIIDAEQVLRAPIPTSVTQTASNTCEDIETLTALFVRERSKAAEQLIFGTAADTAWACSRVGHLADEIAFHVATRPSGWELIAQYNAGLIPLEAVRRGLLDGPLSPTLRRQLLSASAVLTH